MSLLWQMLQYPFLQRALAAGILLSLCAALLGVPLVLKRYSMLGDGLSHVSFGAISVAVAVGWAPLAFSIPVVIAAAFLLLRMRRTRMGGDAVTGVLSSSALAIGVIATTLTSGMTTDVASFMFGSLLAMSAGDAWLAAGVSLAVLLLYLLCYPHLFAVTFDETFARVAGERTELYHSLLAVLTALTVVLGMRMMGAMLISSLLIFPALTAMRLCRSFRAVVLCSAAVSVVCFSVGLTASYLLSLPVGAAVVVSDLCAFLLACLIEKCR